MAILYGTVLDRYPSPISSGDVASHHFLIVGTRDHVRFGEGPRAFPLNIFYSFIAVTVVPGLAMDAGLVKMGPGYNLTC
ncbi:unnamed protein product [Fusarium venenatum]|uniref:Uncharacterized protein n=1 Tax=Fusarium venenatum TaxID=56646 RepID=A0A2L2SQY5_9HYPO|nr:uncharacterized protein FVRRES_13255 [Fusarium venenatum]CEI40744.1 unnamed protein product [Fusarium venenatum]